MAESVRHRPPQRTERIYRVVGSGLRDAYASTWTYKRLADAEHRAEQVLRRGRLIAFDVADVEWVPINQSRFPRCGHSEAGYESDEQSGSSGGEG